MFWNCSFQRVYGRVSGSADSKGVSLPTGSRDAARSFRPSKALDLKPVDVAPRSAFLTNGRPTGLARGGEACSGCLTVYRADASQSKADPRKITPASSLKAAVLHQVLLSFTSDGRFRVIW